MRPESELLKGISLFQFLDDRERTDLAGQLEVVSFRSGETLFHIGEPGEALFAIRSGEVEAFFKNDVGERIVLETVGPGGFVGEISLLDGGPRTASVIATQDTEALRLNRASLEKFLELRPRAAMDLLAAMGRRLRFSSDKLRHTATRNVNEALEDTSTPLQKAADWIAEFAGSILFLMMHVVWFGLWMILNSLKIPWLQFDPYPFSFLTLVVSLEAIFLSVFVLLSQNRQAAKDRVRSDIEYDVNLRAELEIVTLHEKIDRLTSDVLLGLDGLHQEGRKRAPSEHGRG